jgi:hypothetical protein
MFTLWSWLHLAFVFVLPTGLIERFADGDPQFKYRAENLVHLLDRNSVAFCNGSVLSVTFCFIGERN